MNAIRSKELWLTVAGLMIGLVAAGRAAALRAAGLSGDAPPNAGAVEKFVDTLTDNFIWIFGTISVLALVMVGGLFFFGHSRAQDYALKIGAGALLVVLAPGLAA